MNGRQALRLLRDALRESGNAEAMAQSRQMLYGVLHLDTASYLAHRDEPLTAEQEAALQSALARRIAGEPLQYILGEWPFYGRMFACDPRALIPREDTEALVDAALEALPKDRPLRGIDLGTGTGIVGLTLAAERPLWRIACLDLSPDALALARENAARLDLTRVDFRLGDMRERLPGAPYDFIVSNPPYIRAGDLPGLAPELSHEPRLALDGGDDGLDFYRALAERMRDSLAPGGLIAVEVGFDQAEAVAALFAPQAETVWTRKDFAGIDRAVAARKRG